MRTHGLIKKVAHTYKYFFTKLGRRVLVEPCLVEAHGETLARPWYLGSECDGGFAEYCAVPAANVHPVESELSDAELATFACSWSTIRARNVRW